MFERTPGVFRRLHYIIRTCRSGIDVMIQQQQQLNFKFTFCSSYSNQTNEPTFCFASRGGGWSWSQVNSHWGLNTFGYLVQVGTDPVICSSCDWRRSRWFVVVVQRKKKKKRVENPFFVHRFEHSSVHWNRKKRRRRRRRRDNK